MRDIAASFRSLWRGLLGISFEVFLALALISAGFIVCLFWWGIFR